MKQQKRRIFLLFAVFVTDRNINSYSVFIITKSRTGLLQSADSVCLHLFCTPFRVKVRVKVRVRSTKDGCTMYEGSTKDGCTMYEGLRRKYEGRREGNWGCWDEKFNKKY